MSGLSRSEQRQIEAAIKASGANDKDKDDSDSDEDTPMSKKVAVAPKKVPPRLRPSQSPVPLPQREGSSAPLIAPLAVSVPVTYPLLPGPRAPTCRRPPGTSTHRVKHGAQQMMPRCRSLTLSPPLQPAGKTVGGKTVGGKSLGGKTVGGKTVGGKSLGTLAAMPPSMRNVVAPSPQR